MDEIQDSPQPISHDNNADPHGVAELLVYPKKEAVEIPRSHASCH